MFSITNKVYTKFGLGTILYQRMSPPEYNKVQVYSILLDSKRDNPGYAGTLIKPEDVYPADCWMKAHHSTDSRYVNCKIRQRTDGYYDVKSFRNGEDVIVRYVNTYVESEFCIDSEA